MYESDKLKTMQLAYFNKLNIENEGDGELMAAGWQEGLEAVMEGACQMLKLLGGEINYTYTTNTGCKIRMTLDNP